MAFVVFMTLPGLAIVLTAMAFLDLALVRAGRAGLLPWRPPGKQNELEERRSALVMRDDEEDGAPPRSRVDLDGGRAVIRMPVRSPAGPAVTGGSGR
ncbi:DUF6191 domain-containing protein [Streptomyces sp. NPDC054865]